MKRALTLLALAATVCSCDTIDRIFHNGQDARVAAIGKNVLYRSDLAKVVPAGVSAEDSTRMAQQYINSWALGKILLAEAEQKLSKEQKAVDDQVNDFRQSLLTFRYEKLCVAERLDTVVTKEEAQEYFDGHKGNYTFPYSVIRGRVVRISKKSPYYPLIHENYKSVNAAEVAVLEQTAFSSAEFYSDFGKTWVPASELAKAMGISQQECEADLRSSSAYEKDVDGSHYLVFIEERTAPGTVSPMEYSFDKISEIIISRRKQKILSSLEQELFDEALGNGKLKLYDSQDD